MTPADLPPLPETNTVPRDYYTREQIQSYAKLAVRQALERAAQRLESHMDYEAGAVVRAIAEEYK